MAWHFGPGSLISLLTLWHIFHHFSQICQFSDLSSQSPCSPTDTVTASPCSYSAFLSRNCQVTDERSKFHSEAVKGYSTVEKWGENVIIYRNSKLTIQNALKFQSSFTIHACLCISVSISIINVFKVTIFQGFVQYFSSSTIINTNGIKLRRIMLWKIQVLRKSYFGRRPEWIWPDSYQLADWINFLIISARCHHLILQWRGWAAAGSPAAARSWPPSPTGRSRLSVIPRRPSPWPRTSLSWWTEGWTPLTTSPTWWTEGWTPPRTWLSWRTEGWAPPRTPPRCPRACAWFRLASLLPHSPRASTILCTQTATVPTRCIRIREEASTKLWVKEWYFDNSNI